MSRERDSVELLSRITEFVNAHWYPAAYTLTDGSPVVQIDFITDHGIPARIDRIANNLAEYHGISGAEAIDFINGQTLKCFEYIGFDYEKYRYEIITSESLCMISDDLNCCVNRYDIENSVPLRERFISELTDLQDKED